MDGQGQNRLKQQISNGINRAKTIAHGVGQHLNENRTPYITALVVIALLGIANAPQSDGILDFADHMISGALNLPVWAPAQEQGLFEMLSSPEGRATLAGTLAADLGMGILAQGINMSVRKNRRMGRLREGIEPLRTKEKPSHALIGPSEIISDIAISLGTPKQKNRPVVGVHLDPEIPPAYGQEMAYHLRAQNPAEITGRHAPTTGKPLLFIEAAGLDRADEITFACTNPDNALFYGMRSGAQIDPFTITTVLNKIVEKNPNALKGKKINAIIGNTSELGGTVGIRKDFDDMAQKLGIKHNVVIPEELVIKWIKNQVAMVGKTKQANKPVNIVLVGQGGTDDDEYMLQEFNKALSAMDDIEGVPKKRIKISLVKRSSINNLSIDGKKVTEKDQQDSLQKVLGEGDLVLTYGDKDTGTSSLVNMMLGLGIDKTKIHALIERPGQVFDVLNERALEKENVHCIYDMVMDEFKKQQTVSEQITNL